MTRQEKEILGVEDEEEARSLRDLVMKLAGAFEEHVRTEEEWQGRIEKALNAVPAAKELEKAVDHATMEEAKTQVVVGGGKLTAAVIAVLGVIAGIVFGIIEATH